MCGTDALATELHLLVLLRLDVRTADPAALTIVHIHAMATCCLALIVGRLIGIGSTGADNSYDSNHKYKDDEPVLTATWWGT